MQTSISSDTEPLVLMNRINKAYRLLLRKKACFHQAEIPPQ